MQKKTTPNVCGQLKNDFQLNNSLKIINLNKQQQQKKPMTKKATTLVVSDVKYKFS